MLSTASETNANFKSRSAKNPIAAVNTRRKGVSIRTTKPEKIKVTPSTDEEKSIRKRALGDRFSLGGNEADPETQTARSPAIISAALLQTPMRSAMLIQRSTLEVVGSSIGLSNPFCRAHAIAKTFGWR